VTNDELAKRMESVFMELCALGMMRRTGEGRFSLTEGGERCIRQQQSVLGTSEPEERCPECGKRLEPSGIGGGSWVCVNEECRWVEGGTGCGACHGNGCPKCAPADPPRQVRPDWQCSGCRWGFAGNLMRVCPACGRIGYWTGSVDPTAKFWRSEDRAALAAEESTPASPPRDTK
jgi:ribosomal protein L37AE/L43A